MLTEQFEKWIADTWEKEGYGYAATEADQAYMWLRAFVKEVERRDKAEPAYLHFYEVVEDFGLDQEKP